MCRHPFQLGECKESSLPQPSDLAALKGNIFYEDEQVNEEEEDLNRFDQPPIFDDYGDEELLKFEDYGDEELLDCEELGEATGPSSSCEEEQQLCKEEHHLPLYKDFNHEENEIIFELPP